MSHHDMTKSKVAKGYLCKWSGCGQKDDVLIWGDLRNM